MGRDELFLMQLLNGGLTTSGGWLQVIFLAFLLAVPILWPGRIRVTSAYRRAFIWFALSIVAPSVGSILMTSLVSQDQFSGGGFGATQAYQLAGAAGPVMFGISLIFAMKAVVPGFIPPHSSHSSTAHGGQTSTDVDGSAVDGSMGHGGVAESNSP